MNNGDSAITITKEQLTLLPIVSFPGHITVINSHDEALCAISELRKHQVVGFDTETKPSFRKGRTNTVALIQISTSTDCFLFRINRIGFPNELRALMEDANIIKIGLSLKDDFHVLHKLADFTPAGFIELQDFVKKYDIIDCSLQKIYGIIFDQRISKSQRLSNWEADTLTTSQQVYASIDAWACLRIYTHLKSGNFNPTGSPYRITIPQE
jgi:ribonuclease D